MSEHNYYPAGAYNDPNAPYNQKEPKEKTFDVTVILTLSKETELNTFDYIEEKDEESGNIYYDFSNVNWYKELEQQVNTPLDLIKKFKEYLIKITEDYKFTDFDKHRALLLTKDCDGWREDECEVIPD